MVSKKMALSRRTFLRGAGATVALPLLDAMLPAFTPIVRTAAAPVPRLGFIYTPNGYMKAQWTPKGAGTAFEFSPTLAPLAPYRNRITLVTGLAQREAEARGETPGPHSRASATYLTGCHAKQTDGADVRAGISADQIAASVLGIKTPIPSLELSTERNEMLIGNCESGYSCAYANTISWRNATTPMPMETHPRVVFERLFGDGATRGEQREYLRRDKSILDSVNESIKGLQSQLGPADRTRLDQYFDSIREVEARISRAESRTDDATLDLPDTPFEIPVAFEDHVKIMFDLQVLAYRADLTRVITFQLSKEQSGRSYPNIGVSGPHHGISHHQNDPEKMAQKAKIDAYHIHLLTYYIDKLKNTPDGDGSLLDSVIVLYGGGLGDPNYHEQFDLASVIVGGGCGQMKGGRYVPYPTGEAIPFMNLLVTLLHKVGVPIESLGDSKGELREMSEV